MASVPTWTSHLGHKFPRELIDSLDAEHHKVLQKLHVEPANAHCADCGEGETAWASVNLGVFLCLRCADVHRALGSDISKVKGCSSTYLWGPDEISQMQAMGNAAAEGMYGGTSADAKPAKDATKEQRMELCRKKYVQRLWAMENPWGVGAPRSPAVRPATPVLASATPKTGGLSGKQVPGSIDFDALFKGFDAPTSKPMDVLHTSQWWSGKALRASGTPGVSTTASEADKEAFPEHCLSEWDLPPTPEGVDASKVLPASKKAVPEECCPEQQASGVNVWDDFGTW